MSVLAEVHDGAGLVSLQNEMQHHRDLLRGARRSLDLLRSSADDFVNKAFNVDLIWIAHLKLIGPAPDSREEIAVMEAISWLLSLEGLEREAGCFSH